MKPPVAERSRATATRSQPDFREWASARVGPVPARVEVGPHSAGVRSDPPRKSATDSITTATARRTKEACVARPLWTPEPTQEAMPVSTRARTPEPLRGLWPNVTRVALTGLLMGGAGHR